MRTFRVIGLMSGTSLDGLDIVDVTLSFQEQWHYELHHTTTYSYTNSFLEALRSAFSASGEEITALSAKTGKVYAEMVNDFLQKHKIAKEDIDFIASHGQTIFHQPKKGYTLQIGNGPELSVGTGIPSIVDFRSKDVALGGNGAPLIPVADFLLFSATADAFVNLGGFSNLSFKKEEVIYSYDVCPVNIIFNHLMQSIGENYDKNGALGRTGKVNEPLLQRLNQLSFYQEDGPKSLGWEWVKEEILPLLNQKINLEDQLRTLYEHVAIQLGETLSKIEGNRVLFTGGGAKNSFLIERIQAHTHKNIIIPEEELIDFKEAIGFAFLGALRWSNQTNVWASVTGATKDSCSGRIIYP